jgi:PAS domain S-box-containing protein
MKQTDWKKASGIFALVAFCIGAAALAGWIFNIEALKQIHPALVSMKANTAICLMLAASSLLLLREESASGLRRRMAQLFAAIIALVGLLTLSEYLFHWDAGIDQFLFHETMSEAAQSFPGRMGVAASLNFSFLGMALLFLDAKPFGKNWPAHFFALASAAVTALVFLYYFFGVEAFEPIAIYATIALHTVLAFFSLCAGILFVRPDRGIIAVLLGDSTGSIAARRMVPFALFVPLFLGWLRVVGQRAGYYGTGFGSAILAMAMVLLLVALIWWTATALNRADLQRRKAGESLRQSEEVLRTVTAEARVGLVMVNKERRYLFANQTYADLLGLPNADIVGQRVADVLVPLYDQISPKLDRAFAGERVSYELRLPVHPKTKDERFFEVVYEARIDSPNNPHVVVVITDITERKHTQHMLEKAVEERTAKLRETVQEMEAFSYSVAHDLRAPLRAMQGFSDILMSEHAPQLGADGQRFLSRIARAAGRMDNLIQDVLNYSRVVRADLPLEPVDMEQLLHGIVDTYPMLAAEKAEIVLKGEFPVFLGNEAMLTQVFSNLLGNAVKFVGPQIKPRIQVWAEDGTAKTARDEEAGRKTSRFVRIFVRDNGIGIAADQHEKIFGMFQRANKGYEGTGIGLAIVRKAVERMGGKVGVESRLGNGSTFWVELPRG